MAVSIEPSAPTSPAVPSAVEAARSRAQAEILGEKKPNLFQRLFKRAENNAQNRPQISDSLFEPDITAPTTADTTTDRVEDADNIEVTSEEAKMHFAGLAVWGARGMDTIKSLGKSWKSLVSSAVVGATLGKAIRPAVEAALSSWGMAEGWATLGAGSAAGATTAMVIEYGKQFRENLKKDEGLDGKQKLLLEKLTSAAKPNDWKRLAKAGARGAVMGIIGIAVAEGISHLTSGMESAHAAAPIEHPAEVAQIDHQTPVDQQVSIDHSAGTPDSAPAISEHPQSSGPSGNEAAMPSQDPSGPTLDSSPSDPIPSGHMDVGAPSPDANLPSQGAIPPSAPVPPPVDSIDHSALASNPPPGDSSIGPDPSLGHSAPPQASSDAPVSQATPSPAPDGTPGVDSAPPLDQIADRIANIPKEFDLPAGSNPTQEALNLIKQAAGDPNFQPNPADVQKVSELLSAHNDIKVPIPGWESTFSNHISHLNIPAGYHFTVDDSIKDMIVKAAQIKK